MKRHALALAVLVVAPLLLVACAGQSAAEEPAEPTQPAAASGGETREVETAPEPSEVAAATSPAAPRYIPEGRALFMRFSLARIRATPLAEPMRELFAASGLLRELIGGAPIEPVRDLDAVLVGTPTLRWRRLSPVAGQWVLVLRHALDEASVRSVLARLDAEDALREHQGFASARLEAGLGTPHVVVLPRPREAIIAPEPDLPRVVAVARDQAAIDPSGERALDPDLAAPDTELVVVEATHLPEVPGLPRHGRARVEAHLAGPDRVRLVGSLACATEAEAIAAEPAARAIAAVLGAAPSAVVRSGSRLDASVEMSMDEAVMIARGLLSQTAP